METGALSPEDGSLVERIASQRGREQALTVEIERTARQLEISRKRITPEIIDASARYGDPNFRRAYVATIVDRVELNNDTVELHGTKQAMEYLLVNDGPTHSGGSAYL